MHMPEHRKQYYFVVNKVVKEQFGGKCVIKNCSFQIFYD